MRSSGSLERDAERREERRQEHARSLREAIDRSAMAAFPPHARDRLVRVGLAVEVQAGAVIYRDGDPPGASLLVKGLARIFKSADDGRELTLRYVRPGYVLGLATVFFGSFGAGVQALTRCSLLTLPLETLEELANNDAAVSRAIAVWNAQLLAETADRLVFMWRPLPERVALTLLDLARVDAHGALVAEVSQRELANAAGAARESVARILRDLRSAGTVETFRDSVTILRPDALLSPPPETPAGPADLPDPIR